METNESRLIINKSFDRLMEETLNELKRQGIRHKGAGGTAKLLLAIINKHIGEFYETLKIQHMQGFLSKAKDDQVDMIGELLNCNRLPGETDGLYKSRITKQTLILEAANETAIRLAVLSVEKVKDVILREFTHGSGSFSVYPIIDDPLGYTDGLLDEIRARVKAVKGLGIRATVLEPRLSEVEIKGRILYASSVTEMEERIIRYDITAQIRKYLNERKPGETISINELNKLAIERHESVSGLNIQHFMINGRGMLVVDQKAKWDERYVESGKTGSVSFV